MRDASHSTAAGSFETTCMRSRSVRSRSASRIGAGGVPSRRSDRVRGCRRRDATAASARRSAAARPVLACSAIAAASASSVALGTRSRNDSRSRALSILTSMPSRWLTGTQFRIAQHPLGGPPRALVRVEVEPRLRPVEQVGQGIGRPLRQLAERRGALLEQEVAGVQARRQGQHAEVDLVAQEQLQRTVGGRHPGLVPVEDQHHPVGQPSQAADVVFPQGRAQGPHHILQPGLVGGDHVGVALDHRHPARLPGRRPGQVRAVQERPLPEQRGLGRIQILSDMPALLGHGSFDPRAGSGRRTPPSARDRRGSGRPAGPGTARGPGPSRRRGRPGPPAPAARSRSPAGGPGPAASPAPPAR